MLGISNVFHEVLLKLILGTVTEDCEKILKVTTAVKALKAHTLRMNHKSTNFNLLVYLLFGPLGFTGFSKLLHSIVLAIINLQELE